MLESALVPAAVVAAAIAPALLFLWLVVAADSRPEPARVVLGALALGAVSAVAAAVVEIALKQVVPLPADPWLSANVTALFLAGIPEESLKVPLIVAIALRSRDFDEPIDGVVYGTAVGLGFAALENVGYVAGADAQWHTVAIWRSLLSVPLHGAFGAIAGAYIARARFAGVLGSGRGQRWHRQRLFAMAWLVPTVLHTLFDASVFSIKNFSDAAAGTEEGAGAILLMLLVMLVVGFGTIVYAALLARRIARRQRAWVSTKRLPPAHWRGIWAECLIGIGLCFVAVTLVLTGDAVGKLVGPVLLVAAIALARRCARTLNEAARSRHQPVAPAPT